MAYIGLNERLAREIGNALSEAAFKDLFNSVSSGNRETVVAEQLGRRHIDARLIAVLSAPDGAPGEFKIEWQAKAGGEPQHQWFSPNEPS